MIECICSFEEEYGFLKSETMSVISELIRCKDCKFVYKAEDEYWCEYNGYPTEEDGFCHNAERKEK